MTTPGFPDYARLSQTGNRQLCFFFGVNFTNGQILFQGYVGSWPYTDVFMDLGATADSLRVEMIYYSDKTMSVVVGFRFAIRQSGQFSSVCYGNVSDWMKIQVHTQSGNPIAIQVFGAYATQGYSPGMSVDSLDVPLMFIHVTIPAATTSEFGMIHVHPGPARFLVNSAATSWQIKFRYYDYNTNSIQTMYQSQVFGVPTSDDLDFPLLDAPCFVDIVNNDAAAKLFIGCILTEL